MKIGAGKSTTVVRLPDRFVALVSGDTSATTLVYSVLEAPINASTETLGELVIDGLEGNRKLNDSEASDAISKMGENALLGEIDEWDSMYSRVSIITKRAFFELRTHSPKQSTRALVELPINSSNAEIGGAVIDLLTDANTVFNPGKGRAKTS